METARLIALTYICEPCRICGEMIKASDLDTAIFVGYSADSKSRAAHKECFNKNVPKEAWAFPEVYLCVARRQGAKNDR